MASLPPPSPTVDSPKHTVMSCMIAGNVANFVLFWEKLTSCPWVLQAVSGTYIPFVDTPTQSRVPHPFKFSDEERLIMNGEVLKLFQKGVIVETEHSVGEFISNIFLRPKPDGNYRLILDLTELNKQVEYQHFKMFSLNAAIDLITPGAFMASVDLRDAYYTIPITSSHRKYLRFSWKEILFEFTCLPNGLSPAPRMFTRVLKPIFAELASRGHTLFPYIDDSFIIADTERECKEAVKDLCNLLEQTGFILHKEKSVLQPTKQLKFLGFVLDTDRMLVALTPDKVEKFSVFVHNLGPKGTKVRIRQVAALMGLMTAYTPAVLYGGAHLKALETCKNKALKNAKGNFEKGMYISGEAWTDINWWLRVMGKSPNPIRIDAPEITVTTDASLQGWGAHRGGVATGGRWKREELGVHINALELRAVLLALQSLVPESDKHILIYTDNTTTMIYIRKMGGTKSEICNRVAQEIWAWAEKKRNWLSAAFIPGKLNVLADKHSRQFHDHLEWSLSEILFDRICRDWGTPEVDLFASRNNRKCDIYVSWKPEPESWKVDAFTFKWEMKFFYVFPPFSLIARVARKLKIEGSSAILVTPHWPSQPWFATVRRWARRQLYFPRGKDNLSHQGPLAEKGDVSTTPLVAFLF